MDQSRIRFTPEEIYNKDFKIDTKGYRFKEVDMFLDVIIRDYQEFYKILQEKEEAQKKLVSQLMELNNENRELRMQLELKAEDGTIKEVNNLDLIKRLSQLEKIVYEREQNR